MSITTESDRLKSFEEVLQSSSGEIFISGISMVSENENSLDILVSKLEQGSYVKVLFMNPEWALSQLDNISFTGVVKEDINISMEKLKSITNPNLSVRMYNGFVPLTVTGYSNEDSGEVVAEIVDYFQDSYCPLIKLSREENHTSYDIVKEKFDFYWETSKQLK